MNATKIQRLKELVPHITDPTIQEALTIISEALESLCNPESAVTTDTNPEKIVEAIENTPEKRYKILLACYYIESVEKRNTYTTRDVITTLRKLRMPINTNVSQHLKDLTALGYVMESKSNERKRRSKKKHWQLTRKGLRKAAEIVATGGRHATRQNNKQKEEK